MYIRKLKSGKWYVEINKKSFSRLQKSFFYLIFQSFNPHLTQV